MPFYELVYIARQDLTPIEIDSLTDNFEKILKDNGGKLVSKEYWGLRILAYKIGKNTRGHYVLMYIDSEYPAVKELERIIGFNENIIRKGIFRVDSIPSEPSELMVSVNAKDYRKS